jgi:hypothetical protein
MKLKDNPKIIWPPHGFKYDRAHPNRPEDFAQQATIDSAVELHDQCGIRLDVETNGGSLTFREDTPENRKLANNLLKVAERFRGKTVEQLGEAEVSDDFELTLQT